MSELAHDWSDPDRHAGPVLASTVQQEPMVSETRHGGPRHKAGVTGGFANPARGEAGVRVAGEVLVLRPSFSALVAAEGELGPLFALVERAAEGRLALAELVGLFWHCLRDRPAGLSREAFGEGIVAGGLAAATPALRALLQQILAGR